MQNFDETDHIASGFLMKSGYLIYKDFFSHHFPLPYYWIYLFTPLWEGSPARVISIFRLSVMALYVVNFILVYFLLQNNKSRAAYSVWIIILSLFFTIYHGNMALSETFSAVFTTSVFWIVVPLSLGWEKVNRNKTFALGLFASCAFWTQPLLAPLFLIPLLVQKNLASAFRVGIGLCLANLVPLILFSISGQINGFFEMALWFNFGVYPKYLLDILPEGNRLIQLLLHFLSNEIRFFTNVTSGHGVFQFLLHLSLIVFLVALAFSKSRKYLFAVLLVVLLTRIREMKIVAGVPFNFAIYPLLSISAGAFSVLSVMYFKKAKATVVLAAAAVVIVSCLNLRPIIIQSLEPGYNYHVFWSYRQDTGALMNSLSEENEPILVYPHDADLYFFADRFPADRFIFWFPWVNDVEKYRGERLHALKTDPPVVVYTGSMNFKDEAGFYLKYFPELIDDYVSVPKDGKDTGVWIRKDLQGRLSI